MIDNYFYEHLLNPVIFYNFSSSEPTIIRRGLSEML